MGVARCAAVRASVARTTVSRREGRSSAQVRKRATTRRRMVTSTDGSSGRDGVDEDEDEDDAGEGCDARWTRTRARDRSRRPRR